MAAIEKLDGHSVKGKIMKVSLARYNKGGVSFSDKSGLVRGFIPANRGIRYPSYCDGRRFVDVVKGKQQKQVSNPENNTIPILFSIKLDENLETVNKLKLAVVVENAEPLNLPQIIDDISGSNVPITGMNSLSPCKMLLFFNNENDISNALDESSKLWNTFDDLRRWTEGEYFNDRLVWIECFGLHPKGWSLNNVRKIGENWGPVLYVDQSQDELQCLSYARMLVQTKAQNRIDVRIRVLFDIGSCDVWVKECGVCGCKNNSLPSYKKHSCGVLEHKEGAASDDKDYVSDSVHSISERAEENHETGGKTPLSRQYVNTNNHFHSDDLGVLGNDFMVPGEGCLDRTLAPTPTLSCGEKLPHFATHKSAPECLNPSL